MGALEESRRLVLPVLEVEASHSPIRIMAMIAVGLGIDANQLKVSITLGVAARIIVSPRSRRQLLSPFRQKPAKEWVGRRSQGADAGSGSDHSLPISRAWKYSFRCSIRTAGSTRRAMCPRSS